MRILQVINSMETAGAEKLLSELIPIFNTLLDQTKTNFFNTRGENYLMIWVLKNNSNSL